MDDEHIDDLIENEKEWRRHLIKRQVTFEKKIDKLQDDVSGIKAWIWIGRGAILSGWGILILWIKSKFNTP